MIEPPCTERYARWCERSASQLMGSLLLDWTIKDSNLGPTGYTPCEFLISFYIGLLDAPTAEARETKAEPIVRPSLRLCFFGYLKGSFVCYYNRIIFYNQTGILIYSFGCFGGIKREDF